MDNHFTQISQVPRDIVFDTLVGMAVYREDRLKWVRQATRSILKQSYRSFVFVVVIDGEIPDDIASYLREQAGDDPRMILMQSKHNVGLSQCMNYIIDWATPYAPDYFFRMDADDISLSQRLDKQIAFFRRHPEVDILGTALVEINEHGKRVGKRKLPLTHSEIVRFLPKRCSMNHPTVAMRFRVFETGHRYRASLRNTQDYFLWIELAGAGFIFTNLADKLLQFRRVNDFYKRRGLSKSINEFKARLYAMRHLHKIRIGNIIYALAVLTLRLMPSRILKLAYKIDRLFLEKFVKH